MTQPEDEDLLEELVAQEYHAYGEGTQLFRWLSGDVPAPREAMFEGVAGCGKTRLIGEWIKAVCNQYPNSQGLVIRKTRVSLNESFLDIWENEVLGETHPAVLNGPARAHRQVYDDPTLGGRVVLGGMDNPVRLFSTQYNWIYVNEMQELVEPEWESLHRALRRPGMPFHLLLGDCNPEDEYHWANQRAIKKILHRMRGRFSDNPAIKAEYIARLRENLTGVRYQRLFLGLWVSATGMIYEGYSSAVHLITARTYYDANIRRHMISIVGEEKPRILEWFLGGLDFGFTAPGCFQVWGFDRENRMYLVAEVYRTGWDLDQWANAMEELYNEFPFRAIVCDSAEPRSIKFLNDRLGPICARETPRIAVEADKQQRNGKRAKFNGFNQVRWLLKEAEDGRPRMYWVRDSLRYGRDPELVKQGKPTWSAEEIVAYVHTREKVATVLTAEQREDSDRSCADHGMDAMRYAVTWAWTKKIKGPSVTAEKFQPNTYGSLFGDAKSLWEKEKRGLRRGRL